MQVEATNSTPCALPPIRLEQNLLKLKPIFLDSLGREVTEHNKLTLIEVQISATLSWSTVSWPTRPANNYEAPAGHHAEEET